MIQLLIKTKLHKFRYTSYGQMSDAYLDPSQRSEYFGEKS